MAFTVQGDMLTVTFPTKDAQGKTLPATTLSGPSWLPFGDITRIDSYSQKESADFGYVTNVPKRREMILQVWSEQKGVAGYVRNRQGQPIPYGVDTLNHRDTSTDDLMYLSAVLLHVIYPHEHPEAPVVPEDESAEGNAETAETPGEPPVEAEEKEPEPSEPTPLKRRSKTA